MLNSNFVLILLLFIAVVFTFTACEPVSDDDPRMKAHQQAIEKGKQRSSWINKLGEADKKIIEQKSETSKDAKQNASGDKAVDKPNDSEATKNTDNGRNEGTNSKSASDIKTNAGQTTTNPNASRGNENTNSKPTNSIKNNASQPASSAQKLDNLKKDNGTNSIQQKNNNAPKTLQDKIKERLENAANKETQNNTIKEKVNVTKQEGQIIKGQTRDTIQKKVGSFKNNMDSIKQKMKNAVNRRKNQFNKTDSLN